MVAFAMTTMVACGEKDNGTDTPGGGGTDLVPEGFYYYFDETEDCGYGVTVVGDAMSYSIESASKGEFPDVYSGIYSYNASTRKGSVEFYKQTENDLVYAGTATFSYNPDPSSITIERFLSMDPVTMYKQNYGD